MRTGGSCAEQASNRTARLAAPTALVERLAAWHDPTMASYPDSATSPTWALDNDASSNTDPAALVQALGMQAHPEGGYFVETWRHAPPADEGASRGAGTAIYFLLERGQQSHWHRVDAAEIWHFYGGDALLLEVWEPGQPRPTRVMLDAALRLTPGPGPEATSDGLGGARVDQVCPQFVVPPGAWQRARPLGRFALVGCTVSPAFMFERFELAPPDWSPPV